jgi:hypothetical protein
MVLTVHSICTFSLCCLRWLSPNFFLPAVGGLNLSKENRCESMTSSYVPCTGTVLVRGPHIQACISIFLSFIVLMYPVEVFFEPFFLECWSGEMWLSHFLTTHMFLVVMR